MDYKTFYMDIINLLNFINANKKEKEIIGKKKMDFYNKYNNYYSNIQVKNKVDFYRKSLNNDMSVNLIKNERTNLKRLNKIINIYYSDLDLYNKLDEITSIFSNHIELWNCYFDLIIPLVDTKFINDLNKIFVFLKNNNEVVKFVRYYSDNIKKYNNFDYAKFIINLYMEKDTDNDLETFLFNMGLDEKTFDYCVDTVCEFDVDLYNKYKKKRLINDMNERANNRKKIIDISKEIKKSFGKGICTYPICDFFKDIPFKYSRNFSSDLLKFVKENVSVDYDVIHDYIYINKLYIKGINKQIKIDELLNSSICIDGVFIEKDEINNVLTYMQDNNYPMINVVFNYLLRKFVNNELILTEIKDIKKRKILIP